MGGQAVAPGRGREPLERQAVFRLGLLGPAELVEEDRPVDEKLGGLLEGAGREVVAQRRLQHLERQVGALGVEQQPGRLLVPQAEHPVVARPAGQRVGRGQAVAGGAVLAALPQNRAADQNRGGDVAKQGGGRRQHTVRREPGEELVFEGGTGAQRVHRAELFEQAQLGAAAGFVGGRRGQRDLQQLGERRQQAGEEGVRGAFVAVEAQPHHRRRRRARGFGFFAGQLAEKRGRRQADQLERLERAVERLVLRFVGGPPQDARRHALLFGGGGQGRALLDRALEEAPQAG